jgi:flavin-dependent dehydrogenase
MIDLVVCGAGPGGVVAAAKAAAAGLRVMLLERHRLPGHKPCGGGLPAVVDGELAGLVGDAISDCRVRWMCHTWNCSEPCLASLEPVPPLWMVQRPRFDHALVQAAQQAGAELRQG